MSNIQLIIEERAAQIGNFLVGRLLPFREKRMVGPFIFIDHMGPVKLRYRQNFDILPHPHIGLSTLTFLFEGSIHHRDSLGNSLVIKPGAVNWMTAGKGIVHSERTPDDLRKTNQVLHGLQIWVALPKNLEQMTPEFFHADAAELPQWMEGDLSFKLIAGELMGKCSPVPVYSPLYMLELKSKSSREVQLGEHLFGESGIYILEGGIHSEGHFYGPKQLLVANESKSCGFTIAENSTIYLFGGKPFPEERFIDWNFVSSDKAIIEAAKNDWQNRNFPLIPGDAVEFVPYPVRK